MVIYENIKKVKVWSEFNDFYEVEIYTYIVRSKFLFWQNYDIRQVVPFLPKPYLDGEHQSNKFLAVRAEEQRALAQIWLEKYKHDKNV